MVDLPFSRRNRWRLEVACGKTVQGLAGSTKFTQIQFVANYLTLFLKSSDFSVYEMVADQASNPATGKRMLRPQAAPLGFETMHHRGFRRVTGKTPAG